MEAMRQALAALGDDASVMDIQPWVLQAYGINIPKNMISSYKSTILRQKAGYSGLLRPRLTGDGNITGGISIADVQIIKDLTLRIGAQKIHELVDVLSR
jgi:hypothetical protein